MPVETGLEACVLGCRQGGLSRSSEAYDRGGASIQRLQQGLDAEVVGVIRPDRPSVIDAEIRGSDPFAFGTAPVGRVERVALDFSKSGVSMSSYAYLPPYAAENSLGLSE